MMPDCLSIRAYTATRNTQSLVTFLDALLLKLFSKNHSEPQNVVDWKGSLGITESNPLLK